MLASLSLLASIYLSTFFVILIDTQVSLIVLDIRESLVEQNFFCGFCVHPSKLFMIDDRKIKKRYLFVVGFCFSKARMYLAFCM